MSFNSSVLNQRQIQALTATSKAQASLNMGIGVTSQPLQGLTLSNTNWANITSSGLSIDLSTDRLIHPDVKKYEIYESPEDVLALSVAWKRLRDTNATRSISKLLDRELFNKVEPDDRTKADIIRDYYSKKILVWKLKATHETNYRSDLNKFIVGDGKKFPETMLPLVYKLPEFYEYDLEMDMIRQQVNPRQQFTKLNEEGKPKTLKLSANLTPIKSLARKTKRTNVIQYWLRDDMLNAAVVIEIQPKNDLQHLWDHIFTNQPQINIDGMYTRRTLDDFEFFGVTNWKLEYPNK